LPDGPLRMARDGLRVAVRVAPRARTDRLLGIAVAQGGRVVKAAVSAPAEDGRANAALLRLLARAWDLPRRDLSIAAGLTNRNKAVRVTGDPQQLIAKITAELAGLPGW
jgi:uncharacterized protein